VEGRVGLHVSRPYTPNVFWGGYSCWRLQVPTRRRFKYAMDWVHYLKDPPRTEWGRLRGSNGHSEPYRVRYFQIDNEPMNNGFTPEKYVGTVNLYASWLRIGVLEWNLSRTYDWRVGLHAGGSLMLYEQLRPELSMSCPALLMRNTTDDPTWTSLIYHDHASWFPGSAYPVEKLFREHYAEWYLASASGTFRDMPDRGTFFKEIATMKPENWLPGTVDAIATGAPTAAGS